MPYSRCPKGSRRTRIRFSSRTTILPSRKGDHRHRIQKQSQLNSWTFGSAPKQNDGWLLFVAQSQQGSKIRVGRDQNSISFCGTCENFRIGRLLHVIVADVNRVVACGSQTLCDQG